MNNEQNNEQAKVLKEEELKGIYGGVAGSTTEIVRAVDWVKFEGSDVGSEDGVPVVVLDGTACGCR